MIDNQNKCMSVYGNIMDNFSVLSKREENKLIKVIKESVNTEVAQEAREKIFNSNIRLVLKEASKFKNFIPLEDLMSAGCEGLWIATERFDPSFKTKFSTYAVPWIKLKVFELLKTLGSMVYVPTNVMTNANKYRSMVEEGLNKTDKELMKELQITQKGLQKVRLAQNSTLSLDLPYQTDKGESESTLANFIPDVNAENPVVEAEVKERRELIKELLNELTPVQKDVLVSRYLTSEKENLSSVGKRWDLSGERIRQVEFQALKKDEKEDKE